MLKKNIKVSPLKIKVYLTLIILLFLLRSISLFSLCILNNSNIIYYLKPLIFINHFSIPSALVVIMYVYLRSERLSFNIIYGVGAIICLTSIFIISISKITIQLSYLYGFILMINNELILYLCSLIILGILHIINVILLDKPYVNRKGIWLTITIITIVMVEEITTLGGMNSFPYPIVGDFVFLIGINQALNTFKKT